MSAPSSTSRVVEVRADGTVVLEVVVTPATAPPPVPVDPPVVPSELPAGVTAIRVGASTYPLVAVNPEGGPWAGGRGPDQLVAYRAPRTRTGTNQYGVAVEVLGGVAGAPQIAIPDSPVGATGYVLSGHGLAADWLLANAYRGATIEPVVGPVAPPVVTPPSSSRTVAVYMMDGVGRIGQVPPEVNQVRIAFLQGSGLVEWGGDSPSQTAAAVTAWRQADPSRRVLISLGGSGGAVNLATLVDTIGRIGRTMPVDGIDWDIEGGALDVAAAVRISRELAAGRPGWVTAFTPPGGPPVGPYLDAAKQCQAAGLSVQLGQQLYDTRIDEALMLSATARAVAVLGAPSVLLGCMVGSDPARYSTNAQWASYMRAALAKWPTLGGAYLWESSRTGTAQWAKDMRAALG